MTLYDFLPCLGQMSVDNNNNNKDARPNLGYDRLPTVLLNLIFLCLLLKEQIATVKRVCHAWNRVARNETGTEPLHLTDNLAHAWRTCKLSTKTLYGQVLCNLTPIVQSGSRLLELQLVAGPECTATFLLRSIYLSCPVLKNLKLQFQRFSQVSMIIFPASLVDLDLQNLGFSADSQDLPKLKHVRLTDCRSNWTRDRLPENLAEVFFNYRYLVNNSWILDLTDLKQLQCLRFLDDSYSVMQRPSADRLHIASPQLKSLWLKVNFIASVEISFASEVLEQLHVQFCSGLKFDQACNFASLKSFSLSCLPNDCDFLRDLLWVIDCPKQLEAVFFIRNLGCTSMGEDPHVAHLLDKMMLIASKKTVCFALYMENPRKTLQEILSNNDVTKKLILYDAEEKDIDLASIFESRVEHLALLNKKTTFSVQFKTQIQLSRLRWYELQDATGVFTNTTTK